MSSAGIRRARSTDARVGDSILDEDRIQIESEKIFKETGDGNTAASAGIANIVTGAGNFLVKPGDTWQGPHGSQFGIVEIIDDTINVSLGTQNYFPVLVLNGEGGADDVLSLIVPGTGVFINQELIVQAGSFAITLKELVAGNILTPETANVVLQPGDYAKLIFSLLTGTWIVIWFSGNVGGGGLSEPIELGFNEVTTQTPPTKTIVAGDQSNPSHIALDQDIEIQLDVSATANKYKSIFVIIDTTGGGFTITWPASVGNPPIISDSVAERVSVILYTINNGVLWTHATSTGSSTVSSGLATNLSNMVAPTLPPVDLDMNQHNILGVTEIDFFQAGQSIQNKADPDGGILYNVANAQSHIFRANLDEIARFEESAASVLRLNMLDHSIRDARDITLSDASGVILFPGSSPAIGFDSVASSLVINYPIGAKIVVSENGVVGSTEITDDSIDTNLLTVDTSLLIGVLGFSPPVISGEFRNDGTDTFVFSGGAVRNLSNIGVAAGGADVFLGNLSSPTTINQNLNFASTLTNNITNLGNLDFENSGQSIIPLSNGIRHDVPIGDAHKFRVNLADIAEINLDGIELFGNSLILDLDGDTEINSFSDDSMQFTTGAGLRMTISNTALLPTVVLSMSNLNKITNVLNPTNPQDVVTKAFGDANYLGGGEFFGPWTAGHDAGGFVLSNLNNVDTAFITASNTVQFSGDVLLGASSLDDIFLNGSIATNIIPDTDFLRDLGSSTRRWDALFANEIIFDSDHTIFLNSSQVKITVNGSGDTFNIDDGSGPRIIYDWNTDDFYPVDNVSNLGRGSNRWVEVFAVAGVINTSFTKFKKNISVLDDSNCMDICNALPTIEYEWKDSMFDNAKQAKKDEYIGKKYVGFNADALSEMLPNAVKDDMIYQNAVIGVLLGSVRHLKKRIDELEN